MAIAISDKSWFQYAEIASPANIQLQKLKQSRHFLPCGMRTIPVIFFLLLLSAAESGAQNTFFNSISPAGYMYGMKRISDRNFVFGSSPNLNSVYIVKQDSTGQQIWNTEIPLYSALVYEIDEAADGGLLVLAHASFGPNTCPYVVRLKANGQLDWIKSYHNTSSDDAKDIIAMPDTGFVLIGGGCSGFNILTRARKDGSIRWQKQYIDGNGGPAFGLVYFALTDNGTTFTCTGADSNNDLLLFKCDTAGMAIWLHTFPFGSTAEYPTSICATNDGVAVSFSCVTWYPTTSYSQAGSARFDNSGNMQWMTLYSFPAQAFCATVVQLSDHSFAIGASMNNPIDSMYRRALLMGINEFGQEQWSQAFSDSAYSDFGAQNVAGIIESDNHDLFVIGSGYTGFFGRFTSTGYGACNSAWMGPITTFLQPSLIAASSIYEIPVSLPEYIENVTCSYGNFNSEYTSCSGVITETGHNPEENEWSLTPDTHGDYEIGVPQPYRDKPVLVEITDLSGCLVFQDLNHSPGFQIPVSTVLLSAGEYVVSVISDNERIFSTRIFVVR